MHTEPIVSEGMSPHAGAWGLDYLVSVSKAIQNLLKCVSPTQELAEVCVPNPIDVPFFLPLCSFTHLNWTLTTPPQKE